MPAEQKYPAGQTAEDTYRPDRGSATLYIPLGVLEGTLVPAVQYCNGLEQPFTVYDSTPVLTGQKNPAGNKQAKADRRRQRYGKRAALVCGIAWGPQCKHVRRGVW